MRNSWTAIVIAAVGLAASAGLWVVLRAQNDAETRAVLAADATGVRNEMAARMEARLLAVQRLAHRIGNAINFGPEQFEGDAGVLVAHFPGMQSIQWLDRDGVVRWVAPRAGNEAVIGFDAASRPARAAAMREARATGSLVATPVVDLFHNVPGVIAIAPVTEGERAGSFAAGVFRLRELLEAILPAQAARQYSVAVASGGREVFTRDLGGSELRDEWGQQESIQFGGVEWDVTLWPTQLYLRTERSHLPDVVLAAGMGTSVLLATAVYLAGMSREAAGAANAAADVLRDEVAQRRAAEIALAEANRELERSNRELQDFASVASHDLQEPLRKIQAFGDRLKVRHGPSLAPEALDYLVRMQAAAGRMQALINDLLAFSRVTTGAQPFAPVDLARVARDVVADLEVQVERTAGRVEIGPMPVIEADPLQMRQLLQNLIANGLKFHKPDIPPVVHVSAAATFAPDPPVTGDGDGSDGGGNGRPAPGETAPGETATGETVEIRVADNGIGFDEKYLDRIFTVFQRLHGRGEYEGTGIGLAVCRKIVERHGGRITARSRPGEGTTFIVTLPRSHAAAAAAPEQAHHPEVSEEGGEPERASPAPDPSLRSG